MQFDLTPAQRALQEKARELARGPIAERAAEIDRTEQYPWDHVCWLKEAGFFGMTIPVDYGGRGAGNPMRDQGLRTIRPGCGFAQEKLGHFAHRYGFTAVRMANPKTVIGGKPFRGVFLAARQLAGAREGGTGFRRLISLGPDQRIAEADLEENALLAQRGGALHRAAYRERREQG